MYQLVSAPLTGASQPTGWAQVVSHSQQKFVCVIALQGATAHELGHDVTQQLLTSNLNSALELHQFTQQLRERCLTAGIQLQFVGQLLTAESCVICTCNGFVYLKRANKIGLILPVQDEVQIVEGKTHLDDVYVLGTAAIKTYEPQLQHILATVSEPDAFITQLMQYVVQDSDSALMAATYVRVVDGSAPKVTVTQVVPVAKLASTSLLLKKFLVRGSHLLQQIIQPLFSRDVYVRRQSTKKAIRIILPILVFAVAAIATGVVLNTRRQQQLQTAQTVLQPIEAELNQIKQIAADQPLDARQRTETVIALLEGKLPQYAQQKTAQSVLQKELQKVRDYYQSISGQQEVNVLPTFFDLRLFQSDFLANRMDIQQNNIFFSDSDKKHILVLDKSTKQTTLLPLGNLSSLKDFTVNGKSVYLLGGGISVFTLGTNATPVVLKSSDLDTEPALAIRSYGNYLYLLHPDKRNIFRYALQDDKTISSPAAWLRAEEKFDLATVQSMAIDGDVWLATKNGEIKRFTTGKAVAFDIKGLKESFSSPLKLFTKDEMQNVYVLEPQKNRLVILAKNGDFVKEVRSTTLASASDVVADESNKTAYVLSGSLVFEVKF